MDRENREMNFEYSDEAILKYMRTSVKCKLEWLDELRRMTDQALTDKQKKIRKEIKAGK